MHARAVSPRVHTAGLLDKLRASYPADEWALFEDIRNTTGLREVVRYADALGVRLWGAPEVHGFELKTSRADWLRELRDPEKSGPLKAFCHRWYLCVPAPRKRIVLSLSELPAMWGLLELGTGAPVVVVEARHRPEAEPLSNDAMRSLFRAAGRAAELADEPAAPLSIINRPTLSRSTVGLACGHVAPRPLAKVLPRALPCAACAAGLPTDRRLIAAVYAEASDEELEELLRLGAEERRRRALGREEPPEGWGEPDERDAAAELPPTEEP